MNLSCKAVCLEAVHVTESPGGKIIDRFTSKATVRSHKSPNADAACEVCNPVALVCCDSQDPRFRILGLGLSWAKAL